MSLNGTEWRERGYGLRKISDAAEEYRRQQHKKISNSRVNSSSTVNRNLIRYANGSRNASNNKYTIRKLF